LMEPRKLLAAIHKLHAENERLDAEDEISRMTTMWNRAPEMVDLHRGKRIDHRVDVWALGTLLYTLALRRHPFETQSSLQILNGGYEMPKASETPYAPSTLQLIIEMLAQDPDRRPSVFDITSKAALLLAEAGTDYGEDDEAVEGGGERGGAYGGLGGAAVVADAQPRDSPPLSAGARPFRLTPPRTLPPRPKPPSEVDDITKKMDELRS